MHLMRHFHYIHVIKFRFLLSDFFIRGEVLISFYVWTYFQVTLFFIN